MAAARIVIAILVIVICVHSLIFIVKKYRRWNNTFPRRVRRAKLGAPLDRQREIRALGRCSDPRAPDVLAEMLSDPNPMLSLEAALALAQSRDARAVPRLKAALSDKSPYCRQKSALALASMRWTPAGPSERVVYAMARRHSEEVFAEGPAAVPFLCEAYKLNQEDSDFRLFVVRSLSQIGGAQVINPLLAALRDGWEPVRAAAAESLEWLAVFMSDAQKAEYAPHQALRQEQARAAREEAARRERAARQAAEHARAEAARQAQEEAAGQEAEGGERGAAPGVPQQPPFAAVRCPGCASVFRIGIDSNLSAMDVNMADFMPLLGVLSAMRGDDGRRDSPDAVRRLDCSRLRQHDLQEMRRHVMAAHGDMKSGRTRYWTCGKCDARHTYRSEDVTFGGGGTRTPRSREVPAAAVREISGVCDICNQPTSTGKGGKVFTAAEMRRATERGFNGMAVGPNALMLGAVGIGKEESYGEWRRKVAGDATDWLLCPSCQTAIRRYT